MAIERYYGPEFVAKRVQGGIEEREIGAMFIRIAWALAEPLQARATMAAKADVLEAMVDPPVSTICRRVRGFRRLAPHRDMENCAISSRRP